MKYMKKLVAFAAVALAITSCNDNFEEGPGRIYYPQAPSLGIYSNEYTEDRGTSYTVNVYVTETNDTVCDVTTLNTANGRANVFSQGQVTYNRETGIMHVDYDESMYEMPARITIAYKNDLSKMTVNIYTVDGGKLTDKAVFTAVRDTAISYLGDWLLPDGRVISLNADSTVTHEVDEETVQKGSFVRISQGVAVTLEGKEFKLTTSEQGGATKVEGDVETTGVATHIMTQPKNDWYELAIGNYYSWLFSDDGTGNLTPSECVLEYSPSREMGRISGWLADFSCDDLTFYWTPGEYVVTPAEKMFATGYTHVQDGKNYGMCYAMPYAIDEAGNLAKFEDDVFTFGHVYYLPEVGGSIVGANNIPYNEDRFEITDYLTE